MDRFDLESLIGRAGGRKYFPYFLCLLIWGIFALSQVGFDDPAEHYPTLEAAGGLLFGYWSPPWEWDSGLRSWIQPLLLSGFLKPWVALGIRDRLVLDSIARVFNCFWALGGIWGIGILAQVFGDPGRAAREAAESPSQLVGREGDRRDEQQGDRRSLSQTDPLRDIAFKARVFFALAWPMAVWGTRHVGDAFCISPLLVGLALATRLDAFSWLISGITLGLAFSLRYTLGPVIGIALVVLSFRSKRGLARLIVCGLAVFVTASFLQLKEGALYLRYLGEVRYPLVEFAKYNLLGKMGQYHASPWGEPFLYLFLLWCPPFAWISVFFNRRGLKSFAKAWALLALSAVAIAVAKHQELRFILPLLPLTLLATLPLLSRRGVAWDLGFNGFMLIVALLLYSEPHGGLVRGLNESSRLIENTPQSALVFAGIGGMMPSFYSRTNAPLIWIDDPAWQKVCEGDFTSLRAKDGGRWRLWGRDADPTPAATQSELLQIHHWAVISQVPCAPAREASPKTGTTGDFHPACELKTELPVSLGNRLRQRISRTSLPQYVYFCSSPG